jgi:hypothetical protein
MLGRLTTVVVAVLAVMMVAGTAVAAEAGASTDTGTTLEGKGKLVARGVGSVDLDGKGKVKLKIVGDVSIVDHSGDAVVWVRRRNPETQSLDERTRLDAGESIYLFNDFRGVIWVRGSDFSLDANGKVRKLRAVGEGTVRLIGHGWWKARHAEGRWGHGIRYAAGNTELLS